MRSFPSKETLSFSAPRSSLSYAPLTTLPSHHFSDQNDSRTSEFGSRTVEFGSRTGEFGSPRSRDKIRSGSILESPQRRMMMSDIEGGGKEKQSLKYQSHSRLILATTSSDQDVLTQRQILLSMTSPDSSFLSSSRSITSNPVKSFPVENNSTHSLAGSGRQESSLTPSFLHPVPSLTHHPSITLSSASSLHTTDRHEQGQLMTSKNETGKGVTVSKSDKLPTDDREGEMLLSKSEKFSTDDREGETREMLEKNLVSKPRTLDLVHTCPSLLVGHGSNENVEQSEDKSSQEKVKLSPTEMSSFQKRRRVQGNKPILRQFQPLSQTSFKPESSHKLPSPTYRHFKREKDLILKESIKGEGIESEGIKSEPVRKQSAKRQLAERSPQASPSSAKNQSKHSAKSQSKPSSAKSQSMFRSFMTSFFTKKSMSRESVILLRKKSMGDGVRSEEETRRSYFANYRCSISEKEAQLGLSSPGLRRVSWEDPLLLGLNRPSSDSTDPQLTSDQKTNQTFHDSDGCLGCFKSTVHTFLGCCFTIFAP